jgi:RimJ/RimL family protein N-acetyltransferase
MALPVGPEVDATPRPLPPRTPLRGQYAVLEPLHKRHAEELWRAAQGADESFTYLPSGPFATREAMIRYINDFASDQNRVTWAVRPIATGVASGWLSLLDIQPKNASTELGSIWFAPVMQRTRGDRGDVFAVETLGGRSGVPAAGLEVQRAERAL